MSFTRLHHDPRLAAPPPAGPVPAAWRPPEGARVVSFRPPAAGRPDAEVGTLNATSRLLLPLGERVATYGLEADSQLAPLLLWDIAHALPVGGSVTQAGEFGADPYLGRAYFRAGLEVAARTATETTFRKVAELPAEAGRGLERWTFGIPTGPGDATGLNAVVKRILELGVPEFEILLCGNPGANFRYADRVRVVGADLNRAPVPIAAKKNRLADEARYENLCLLHDRVFLPRDFTRAVTAFGDLYPIVAFQSLWSDDPYNLTSRRYSDYSRTTHPWASHAIGGADPVSGLYRRELFPELASEMHVFPNALRYHPANFCTGSLYLCKKAVWQVVPQDARLNWSEFEDVEHGTRASAAGVPSRLNPHAFTQSLFARALLVSEWVRYETAAGGLAVSVSPVQSLRFARKPLHKVSKPEALARLATFCRKWLPEHYREGLRPELGRRPDTTAAWQRQVGAAIYGAAIGFGVENVEAFVADVERYLVCDTADVSARRFVVESFAAHGGGARDTLVDYNPALSMAMLLRPQGNLFYDSLAEYFPERTWKLALGTRLTAWRLARHDGATLHTPGGFAGYHAALLNSTPFRDYYEE